MTRSVVVQFFFFPRPPVLLLTYHPVFKSRSSCVLHGLRHLLRKDTQYSSVYLRIFPDRPSQSPTTPTLRLTSRKQEVNRYLPSTVSRGRFPKGTPLTPSPKGLEKYIVLFCLQVEKNPLIKDKILCPSTNLFLFAYLWYTRVVLCRHRT